VAHWTQAAPDGAAGQCDPYASADARTGAWAWPANRRVLYNRRHPTRAASPGTQAPAVAWTARPGWFDVLTMRPDAGAERRRRPSFMTAEGVARMFDRPAWLRVRCRNTTSRFRVSDHDQSDAPEEPEGARQPAARVFKGDMEGSGNRKSSPYAATTIADRALPRLDQHARDQPIIQPEQSLRSRRGLQGEGITPWRGIRFVQSRRDRSGGS